jgi:hypothetical protein
MLIRLIKGEQTEPARVTLPTELVVRQSCAPPAAVPRPRRRPRTATASTG